MAASNILIVDDEANVRLVVSRVVKSEGMVPFEAASGEEAIRELDRNVFDLVILDINLEDMDGFEVVSNIRRKNNNVPIFFLSGRTEDSDVVLGLGLGADEYIKKPFSPIILGAKIKAFLRRVNIKEENREIINYQPFTFDKNSLRLYKNGKEIQLSSKEMLLIKYFLENPERVFTKEQLYENVWNDKPVGDNIIMVYVRHLRTKIEDDPNNPRYLKTIWGVGYKLTNK